MSIEFDLLKDLNERIRDVDKEQALRNKVLHNIQAWKDVLE